MPKHEHRWSALGATGRPLPSPLRPHQSHQLRAGQPIPQAPLLGREYMAGPSGGGPVGGSDSDGGGGFPWGPHRGGCSEGRVRVSPTSLFWQNFCSSEILQAAFPYNILPYPPLEAILHPFHLPTVPGFTPTPPFALQNRRGQPRITMPTLVSFPRSHAFRPNSNFAPGEGNPPVGGS